ncbi:hypothetical protein TSUD_165830 [Trifolium subterraneum]|uniref:Rad21/Rec8-like protein N-terminal domain-containing protein n=1 Tax=Trifolium subterraneum TaxID=3900 RepID=A0A2Z6MM31_TRISU|nr:hypothetical protein TSUD_165830 [Trifolium subterraneum]
MLKSKEPPLCSCKNPLWVAAFFFKQLKKAQIMDTDISSSVDKIMHYEMDAVSYRILAYLLLGVVKTYSKKVEYLLHDCNNMISGINKFVINTKNNAPVEAVCMAFTMPDTFELDALDVGELEDTSGYHTAPPEQITLKEVLSNTGGFAQFSQERFEDFDMQFEGLDFGETSCSLDHIMAENTFLQFQAMDFDFEVFPSNSRNNLIEGSSEKQLSRNNLIEESSEKQLEFQKKVSFEDGQSSAKPSESTTINETPQSKFHDDSIARPKPGATKPDFMLIPTPDATERAHFSKKRKFVIDEMTTLSNTILRKRIHDASDVVSVRKPLHVALIDKKRKTQMFSLLNGFNESLFPCHSPKLQRLFSNSKLKIPVSLQIGSDVQESEAVDIPEQESEAVDFPVQESEAVDIPEHIQITPEIPPSCPSLGNEEILREFDAVESQACGSSEHIATAPQTPPLGPSSPRRSIERGRPSESSDIMAEEEINSCETENSEMSGWSEQTSKVATYLCKRKEAGSINLSKVSEGRTRKESARLFYEILVLKTTNYVDVQQKDAYGDIEVRKLPKFDKTFGV